jgi:hypothetical protein
VQSIFPNALRFPGLVPGLSPFILASLLAACGGTTTPATAPGVDTQAPAESAVARELGALPPGDCKTKSFLDQLGACTALPAAQVSGSGTTANIGSVSDGDACSAWSAGGVPPQNVDIDVGQPSGITALLLIPDLTPPTGDIEHDIRVVSASGALRIHLDVTGSMTSGHGYAVQIAPVVTDGRFVRITTLKAPGWVGWREIVPLSCK